MSKSLLTQELLGCAWVFSDIVKQLEQLINNKPLSRLMLNLTKLHLTVSKSLLTQELLGCAWVFSDIVKQLEQLINNLHNCL